MEKQKVIESIEQAISQKMDRKFKQSVEVIFNFKGVKVEGEHKINLNIFLPKGRGKEVEVGVFAEGDMYVKAKPLSTHVLNKAEIEDYTKDKRRMRKFATQCYNFIAQADMMGQVGKTWGIVLGPRGKMPQPVPPNANLEDVIQRVKNTVRIKTKKFPIIMVPVGVEDMSSADIADNIVEVYTAVERVIPKEHIESLYIKTTMGKAVRVW